jgi:hypothetical protein
VVTPPVGLLRTGSFVPFTIVGGGIKDISNA